ncbi:MAG: hypothetical protein U5L00_10305 [Desulfovermiculus sp.]|nr:hypothetical protein [Desulfovermiculus sp.]
MSNPALKYSLTLAAILVLIAAFTVFQGQEPIQTAYAFLRHDIHPGLFLLLMGVLPVFGFPMSPFLALAGIKFGTAWGAGVSLLIMPVHLSLCYLISKTFFQTVILKVMQARGYSPPAFLTAKPGKLLLLFLIIPGPPYVMKNYILALTGLPFVSYMGLTWAVQGLLALPIVILGGTASQQRWGLFTLVLVVLILGSIVLHWYRNTMKKSNE